MPAKKPSLQNISTDRLSWALSKLADGEKIKIDDIANLPEQARPLLTELKKDDANFLLIVPINRNNELVGFIGFDVLWRNRAMPDHISSLLELAAEIIGHGLERKEAEEQVNTFPDHDILTNLPNHRLLIDHLDQALAYCKRRGEILAVILINLDNFKKVNGNYGRNIGDLLLKNIGSLLTNRVRRQDTVARTHDDEFVVLLVDIKQAIDGAKLATEFNAIISKPRTLDGKTVEISASIGVSEYPIDGEVPNFLVRKARIAMYQAKRQGGGTFQTYKPTPGRKDEVA